MNDNQLKGLERRVVDLCIIGGGIVGSGLFRDAAMRGMSVVLLEKDDFAHGTSSRSSKLVHGGLRYLEMFDFHLVFEACQERNLLRRMAPYLVRPLPFLFPVYKGMKNGLGKIKLGLTLYDLLSSYHNIRPHQILSSKRVAASLPALSTEGLTGAALYYDAFVDDARLVVETLRSAPQQRAYCFNYTRATAIQKEKDHLLSIEAVSADEAQTLKLTARAVVVAAGPWASEVAAKAGIEQELLQLSKGVHLVVEREKLPVPYAVVMQAKQDERVMFAIPWGRKTVIGTTDTQFEEDLEKLTANRTEAAYLLDTVNAYFPAVTLTEKDVLATFSGVRPLVQQAGKSTYRASREDELLELKKGFFFILGGKLTTYRRMAKDTLDKICAYMEEHFEKSFPASRTAEEPLLGGDLEVLRPYLLKKTTPFYRHLIARYGVEGAKAFQTIPAEKREKIVPDSWISVWEVERAVQKEWAKSIEDVLLRRTRLGLLSAHRLAAVDRIAEIIAPLLGWDVQKKTDEIARTKALLRECYPSGEDFPPLHPSP